MGIFFNLCCFKVKVKSRENQQTINIYYDKTVDLTPEARERRSHEIPEKDANTPSEELTEVGNQRLYKNATIPLYMRDYFEVHFDFKDDAWMPSNRTKYENLAILKTHSRRNLMHLASRFHRDLHVPFSGGNKQRVLF